ncbi:Pantoate-beta-alanine ligase [seawater metagenome]|uniref:pantoate--beta-alanine ligase (AMP-forming) n=1 Tax=seawater metagenome TaxID=1561972 RepID=A0A5E8CI61_9ZZZZ
MEIFYKIKDLKNFISKYKNLTIGFVPTMGSLHQGHISLVQDARKENDIVVVSIFVNKLQFDQLDDYLKYPRTNEQDIDMLTREHVDVLFLPHEEILYPLINPLILDVGKFNQIGEGLHRKQHLNGVATIVLKFLNIIFPHTIYLGQKDALQCALIQYLVKDFFLNIQVKICPTIRNENNLALSSRNVFLTPKEKLNSSLIYESLELGQELIKKQESISYIKNKIKENLENFYIVEYININNLNRIWDSDNVNLNEKIIITLAIKTLESNTRIIDNIIT